jgi:hypothetical protein
VLPSHPASSPLHEISLSLIYSAGINYAPMIFSPHLPMGSRFLSSLT